MDEPSDTRGVEYNALKRMTSDLCKALPINDLFPSMISHRVIDFQEKADICGAKPTESKRVEAFIENLIKDLDFANTWDTTRFYRFLAVMRQSSKCNFLLKRINHWMEEFRPHSAKPNAAGYQTGKPASTSSKVNTSATPATRPATSTSDDDDSLVTGKDAKRCMILMHKIVIPRISKEWEAVSTFLEYTIAEKKDIKRTHKTPRQCCTALLEDWVSTERGVKPKTWKKLIEVLREIEELARETEEIKQCLLEEGVTISVDAVEDSHDYDQLPEEEATTPQPTGAAGIPPYGQAVGSSYYDDVYHQQMAQGQRWNSQPHPPQHMMGSHEQMRYPVNYHDVHPTAIDQMYREPMHNAPVPPEPEGPVPRAFIVYAKEVDDPGGAQVLCLSNLLNQCGISCDIDLYHMNENIVDWSFWVVKNIELHTVGGLNHVILVCSPTMIGTLEERIDNARVEMVAGNIDRLALRHYIQTGVSHFLPVFIGNPSSSHVPANLSGKNCFCFPYDKLHQLPEATSAHQILDHPDFTSLKSMVATLTGQPEYRKPDIGPVPQIQAPRNNMYTGAPPTGAVQTDTTRYDVAPTAAPPMGTTHGNYTRPTAPLQGYGYPTGGVPPVIIRRDADLPPSANEPDDIAAGYQTPLTSVRTHMAEDEQLRSAEFDRIQQEGGYGDRSSAHTGQPLVEQPWIRQSESAVSSIPYPQEEVGSLRPGDDGDVEDDYYSAHGGSPRVDHESGQDSYGTVAEAQSCSGDHSSYYPTTLKH